MRETYFLFPTDKMVSRSIGYKFDRVLPKLKCRVVGLFGNVRLLSLLFPNLGIAVLYFILTIYFYSCLSHSLGIENDLCPIWFC